MKDKIFKIATCAGLFLLGSLLRAGRPSLLTLQHECFFARKKIFGGLEQIGERSGTGSSTDKS